MGNSFIPNVRRMAKERHAPMPFVCPDCGLRFRRQQWLDIHYFTLDQPDVVIRHAIVHLERARAMGIMNKISKRKPSKKRGSK